MFTPRLRQHARRAALVAIVLAVAPTFLACAEVERTVVDKELVREGQREVRTVTWESGQYSRYSWGESTQECWGAAAVGQPVPDSCLTAPVLASETDLYRRAPWIAGAGTAVAIGLLTFFAFRWVAWQPAVELTTSGKPNPRHFDEVSAISLMQSTEDERAARIYAERYRRDPSHPFLTGCLVSLVALIPLVLVVGYGSALGWGLHTGIVLLVLAGPPAVLIVPNIIQPGNVAGAVSRIAFLGGATATLLFGVLFALLFRAPLLNLNGIDWPN